jgi:hypothetical protein
LRSITPTPVTSSGSVDPQIVEALVPNLGIFTFRFDPGRGSSSPPPSTSSHPSSSHRPGGSSSSSGTGGLGGTGVDVALLLLIGVGALGAGWLILLPGRRRKHS